MGVRHGVSKGVEDGHGYPPYRRATPEMAVRNSRAWRAFTILLGVHGHPLPYAHAALVSLKWINPFAPDGVSCRIPPLTCWQGDTNSNAILTSTHLTCQSAIRPTLTYFGRILFVMEILPKIVVCLRWWIGRLWLQPSYYRGRDKQSLMKTNIKARTPFWILFPKTRFCKHGASFTVGKCHDWADSEWKPLRGHNDMPFGRPTRSRPIGHPAVGHP
jgi:hypothetical protein